MSKPGAFGAPAGLSVATAGLPDPPGNGGLAIANYSTGGPKATTLVTLTPSGGNPPYRYAWTYVSGDRRPTYLLGPDLDEGQWQASPKAWESFSALWQWKVTDARGRTASGQVEVEFASNL